jgi:hypothetical protein
MSNRHERVNATEVRKPQPIDINDLTDEGDTSIDQRDMARRAVADATKAFEKFADELTE